MTQKYSWVAGSALHGPVKALTLSRFSFLRFSICDRMPVVSIRLTIFRLLSVLAVCGLIAAPVVRPASAMAGPEFPAATSSTNAEAPDGMMEDMPCCPKTAPAGCQDCPMMSLCHSGPIVSLYIEASVIAFSSKASVVPLLNEAHLSGQAQGPPRRPPKA